MLSSSCSVQSFSFLLKSTLALNMYSDVEMYVFILFLFVTLLLSKYNRIRFVNYYTHISLMLYICYTRRSDRRLFSRTLDECTYPVDFSIPG